jgi:hypothetical protein
MLKDEAEKKHELKKKKNQSNSDEPPKLELISQTHNL